MIKITVITVCYNAVNEIKTTIESVINQTYSNVEYIIVDGGSTDGTIDIIREYESRITRWVSEPDRGIYDAMNKGIRIATGDYINFMNAGDCFVDNTILEQVSKRIPAGRTIDIIYGNSYKHDKLKKWKDYSHDFKVLHHHGAFCHQSGFIRTDYHKSNLFDLKYKYFADFDFFHKSYMAGASFQQLDIFIADYNAETGASLTQIEKNYKEFTEIIKDTDTVFYRIYRLLRHTLGRINRFFK